MRFRQVHLDFHTSGALQNIGRDFSKENFQQMLKLGYVDSITVFSKCHHGYSYHPTKVNEMHPGLGFDLLGAQLEACKEIGVNAPVYISAGLDEKEAVRHPEWLVRNADESTTWAKDFVTIPGYHRLCNNTGYLDLLIAQIEEVMERYRPCGVFLDIVGPYPCYCASCRKEIAENGGDINNLADVMTQAERVYKRYTQRVEQAVRKYSATATIFHNAGHVTRGRQDLARMNTHLELESLPTGGWGYDHFPLSAAYARTLGMDFLGMTGKFHQSWGEFGGFKHPNALRYETALSVANGAGCSIGDQLHPLGEMNRGTYGLIGKAYAEIEQKEPWLKGAKNLVDIAVLSTEAMDRGAHGRNSYSADVGANRILKEGHYLYNFIDQEADFNAYQLLILPDAVRLDEGLAGKLKAYLAQGGKLLATGQSGLWAQEDAFALPLGVTYLGESTFQPSYMEPIFPMTNGAAQYVMYEKGYRIQLDGGEAVAYSQDSYFNRSIHAFCSHRHTPNDPSTRRPAAAVTENTAYVGWDVFTDYANMGSLHLKEIIVYLLDRLLGLQKQVQAALPDKGVTTLTEQKAENRLVHHLLYAHTTLRGKDIEVIEDVVPLYQVACSVACPQKPKRVVLQPQGEELPFEYQNGRVSYTVPKVEIHQMAVIEQ